MQFIQERNDLSCPFCDSNIQDFRKHISDRNGNSERSTLSNCNSCDLVIQNENCMKKHEERVHGGLYSGIICEECNIDFFGPKNLKYHQELSHNEDVRTKIHAFEANANNIADEESESEAKKHDCSFCTECFQDEKMLQTHYRTNHMEALTKMITNCEHGLPRMSCKPCKTFTISNSNGKTKVKESNVAATDELVENFEDALNGNFKEQNEADSETIELVNDVIEENTKEFQRYKELLQTNPLETIETKSNDNIDFDSLESKNEDDANVLELENELFYREANTEINFIDYEANDKRDTDEKRNKNEHVEITSVTKDEGICKETSEFQIPKIKNEKLKSNENSKISIIESDTDEKRKKNEHVEITSVTKDGGICKETSEFQIPKIKNEKLKSNENSKISLIESDTIEKHEEKEVMNVVENVSEKSLEIQQNTKMTKNPKKEHDKRLQKSELKMKQPHRCKICGFTCGDINDLVSHLKVHEKSPDKPYIKFPNPETLTCRNCNMPVPRKTCSQHKCNKSKSIKIADVQVQNECTLKTQEIIKNNLEKDSKVSNAKMIQCGKCDQTFGSKADKSIHIRDQHYSYECKECVKFFENQSDFSKHLNTIHNAKIEVVAKNDPGSKNHTESKELLKKNPINTNQALTQEQIAKIKCTICNMTFTSFQTMKDHVGKYHKSNLSKMNALSNRLTNPLKADEKMKHYYQCDKCPSILKTFNELGQHLKLHDQQAVFKCEICQRKHISKNDLDFHLKKSHKPCDHCKLVSKDLGQHQNHMILQHSFPCDVCKQSFISSELQKQHKMKCNNFGIKRISCRYCFQIFFKSEYDEHLKKCDLDKAKELHEQPAPKRSKILA